MGKIFGISDILNAVFNRDANKLKVETDLQIDAVTVTDVTIHDAVATDNKLKVNEDGSVPVELKGSLVEVAGKTYSVSGGDTLRGKAADKPDAAAAHAVIPYCYYFSIDTGVVEATDGTDWVVM